jgi:hypothetical protein
MDIGLWLGVISLVLAIPLGIASNLLTTRFIGYLEKRKILKTHKTKQTELRMYRRVKAFREGTRDRYPFYIMLAGSGVGCLVAGCTCVIVAFLVIGVPLKEISILFAITFVLLGTTLLFGINETAKQLENFDEYKAMLENRWGPIIDAEGS